MKLFCLTVVLTFTISLSGQTIYEKYKLNESALLEELVALALKNNPQVNVYRERIKLAEENNSQARLSWFNNVNLSYQYNPGYSDVSGTSSFPKFGIGLSVNLGNIINTPSRISQTESEIAIAQADLIINAQFLRAETTRRIANYIRSIEMLKIRDQAVNDSESTLELIKHRFEMGETTLEELNKAMRSYTDNKERRTESLGDIIAHRASLEEILGIKLGDLE